MKIGANDISKIYLGGSEVTSIYLGTSQVYSGGSEPPISTDVPLNNTFAVKYQGTWVNGSQPISYIDDIVTQLHDIGIHNIYEIEELSIGNLTNSINLDGGQFSNCTGLTLAPSVTGTTDIHSFPAMQWVNVMGDSLDYQGSSGLFSDMHCCPIYVPEASLSDYQSAWKYETTYDCPRTVAARLVGWTPPPHDYSQDYLTFVAEADNMSVILSDAGSNMFQYSTDGGAIWNSLANNQSTPSVNSGETIMFKAQGLTPSSSDGIGALKPTANASVQGNIMSLVYGNDFVGQTVIFNRYQFLGLFYGGAYITSAENLILPATTLEDSCYRSMFATCTSLTTAPELPAVTLVNDCYFGMFRGCTSLNYIKCLAINKSATMTRYWVQNVGASGTFVKPASTSWTTGNDGIPNGWTVQDAD